jgi:hypothetical protein
MPCCAADRCCRSIHDTGATWMPHDDPFPRRLSLAPWRLSNHPFYRRLAQHDRASPGKQNNDRFAPEAAVRLRSASDPHLPMSNRTKPRRVRCGSRRGLAGQSIQALSTLASPLGARVSKSMPIGSRLWQPDARWIRQRNLLRAEVRARRAYWRLRTVARRVQDRTAVRSGFPGPTRCAGWD